MYTVFCTIAATYGFGQHTALLSIDQFVLANKMEIIGQTFCIIGIATSKAGVAAFQLRIFEKLWQKILLISTASCVAIICILVALFDFIRCNPVAAVWNPTITDAQCFVSTPSFTIMSITLSSECYLTFEQDRTDAYSHLCCCGLHLRYITLGCDMEVADETKHKIDHLLCNEPGYFVSLLSSGSRQSTHSF